MPCERRYPEYMRTMPCSRRRWWEMGLYALIIAVTLYYVISRTPEEIWNPESYHFILIIGILALWRYGWKLINFVRAALYKYVRYPAIRFMARRRNSTPKALYILVTSYRIPSDVNFRVYYSIFRETAELDCPVYVISLSTDPSDAAIFEKVRRQIPGENIRVFTIFQEGLGKRIAMYEGLQFIKTLGPPPDSAIVLMDGDCVLGESVVRQSYQILHYRPDIGAVTTNNTACVVDDRNVVREWYNLRMANRDFYMCSLSLSGKVLVLTGRFSMFRAQAIMSDEFIQAMKYDAIQHWRFNRIKMLTGDDKTTWFYLIRDGWKMLYLPDVYIYPVEELPQRSFIRSSIALSRRWYGNMLRNNGRALKLGPHRVGIFPWLALLDQRISIWTTLSAPFFALMTTTLIDPGFIYVFIAWIIMTRTFQSLLLYLITRDFHPLYIPLLVYDQYFGAFIKVYTLFHINKQKWNRQNIATEESRRQKLASDVLWLSSLFFILSMIYLVIIHTPGLKLFS